MATAHARSQRRAHRLRAPRVFKPTPFPRQEETFPEQPRYSPNCESHYKERRSGNGPPPDPVRDKPRRSGRGRIPQGLPSVVPQGLPSVVPQGLPSVVAQTAQPSLGFGFSAGSAAARCTGARWKWAHLCSLKRSRTATTARLSSSASGYRVVPCAAGGWIRP